MSDTVSKRFKADTRVIRIILDDLLLIQPAAIPLVQLQREIPVVKRYERHDPSLQAAVNESVIVLDALFVYRIISAAEWDDS